MLLTRSAGSRAVSAAFLAIVLSSCLAAQGAVSGTTEDVAAVLRRVAAATGVNMLIEKSVHGRVESAGRPNPSRNAEDEIREIAEAAGFGVARVENILLVASKNRLAAIEGELKNRHRWPKGSPVSVDLENAEISVVLKTVADSAGFRLYLGESVRGKCTVRIDGVEPSLLLRCLASVYGYSYRIAGGIHCVNLSRKVAKTAFLAATGVEIPVMFLEAAPVSGVSAGSLPVLKAMKPGWAGETEILRFLSMGMGITSLKLGVMARNYAESRLRGAAGFEVPLGIGERPLFIRILPGGNRPKTGFRLLGETLETMADEPYIEMPPEPARFQAIFAHEHGHLIDSLISPVEMPPTPERFIHTTPAVTDYATAFFEGWGNHFEAMTCDLSPSEALEARFGTKEIKGRAYLFQISDLLTLSQGFKRGSWVRQGLFAFARIDKTVDGPAETFAQAWSNPSFDLGRLKNPQQMLACEGLLATLFLRIASDRDIQNRYLEPGFYAPFLGFEPAAEELEGLVGPLENGYLKMIRARADAMARIKGYDPPLAALFMKSLAELSPGDARDAALHFCETTMLVTAMPGAGDLYRETERAARGSMQDFQGARSAAVAAFEKISGAVAAMAADTDSFLTGIGPSLWVRNDRFSLESSLGVKMDFLDMNLNSAETFELLTVPGMDRAAALRLIDYRDEHGPFESVEALQAAGLPPEIWNELSRMRAIHPASDGKK